MCYTEHYFNVGDKVMQEQLYISCLNISYEDVLKQNNLLSSTVIMQYYLDGILGENSGNNRLVILKMVNFLIKQLLEKLMKKYTTL